MQPRFSLSTAFAATVAASAGVLISYFYFTTLPSKKRKPKLQGMVNLGNTCFANALLQSFASCSTFVSWFHSAKKIGASNLLSQLSLTIDSINSNKTLDGDANDEVSARGVIEALEKRKWKVGHHVQQDLFELLNVFITTWDEEISEYNSVYKKVSSLVDVQSISELKIDDVDVRGLEFLQLLSNSLEKKVSQRPPCAGLIAVQFICTSCGHKHVRHDRFCALSLSLPKVSCRPCITIEHCLQKHFAVEKLYNVTCDNCKEKSTNPAIGKSNFYKNMGFSKLPDCLILHLDRVNWLPNGQAYKQDDYVQFDELLDVSKFMFYNNKTRLLQPSMIVGGRYEHRSAVLEKGYCSTSPLNHLSALSRNVGGLQQRPTVLLVNEPPALQNLTLSKDRGSPRSPSNGESVQQLRLDDRKTNVYKLKAVATHWGHNHDWGHFAAYRRGNRHQSDEHNWYLTSDCDIKPVKFGPEVASCQAYMLFYERVTKLM